LANTSCFLAFSINANSAAVNSNVCVIISFYLLLYLKIR